MDRVNKAKRKLKSITNKLRRKKDGNIKSYSITPTLTENVNISENISNNNYVSNLAAPIGIPVQEEVSSDIKVAQQPERFQQNFGTNPEKKKSRGWLMPFFLFLKTTKYLVITIVVLIILSISLFTFIFIRHRQLCQFQTTIDNTKIVSESTQNYCPNPLDIKDWGKIILNAFNPFILKDVKVNYDYTITLERLADTKESCEDPLDPVCWVTGNAPKLKQTEDGYTNFFLVGLDSKEEGYRTGLKNTDSMLLVTIDNNTGGVLFTSFPRDMYLSYYRPNGYYTSYKLNAVYSIDGIEGLNGVIEQVTGMPIHYYAYINLDIFTRVIDRLGGITIELQEPFEDMYPCGEIPASENIRCSGYKLFEFDKGIHTFDSFDASVYSRSRLLSTDYARAERQQLLIKALMKNVLEDETPIGEKLNLYLDLFGIFKEEVESNIEPADIGAAFALTDIVNGDAGQMVVTAMIGGYGQIIYSMGEIEGLGTNLGFRDSTYATFQNYRNNILRNIALYTDKPKVKVVYKDVSITNPDIDSIIEQTSEYVEYIVVTDPSLIDFEGSKIYDFSNGTKSASLRQFLKDIEGSNLYSSAIENIVQSEDMEDILILVGSSNLD